MRLKKAESGYRIRIMAAAVLLVLSLSSCAGADADLPRRGEAKLKETEQPSAKETVDAGDDLVYYEAEDAVFKGTLIAEAKKSGFSGSGYVTAFREDGDTVSFEIEAAAEGTYDLVFGAIGREGRKENFVYVDGSLEGLVITPESVSFRESSLERVYLTEGTHKVEFTKHWGWVDLDYMYLKPSAPLAADIYEAHNQLADPEADDCARRLMDYMCSIYGKQMLSGQYSEEGPYGTEFELIRREFGKSPAILGLDMKHYTITARKRNMFRDTIPWAVDYWNRGGIVTLCWHWYAPEKYVPGEWWQALRTSQTEIDLGAIMNGEDPEGYELLMADMDDIAEELQELQRLNIPVLWRPLHEASGGWFWWGGSGPDSFIKLWRLMFDKFTQEYGLHNLIWVYSGMDRDWYPGDGYVDIIGEDIYPGDLCYSAQGDKFLHASEYTQTRKMLMISECSSHPDPDNLERDGIWWSASAMWGGSYLTDSDDTDFREGDLRWDMLKKYYQHENVVTLDELPDLRTDEW